MTQKEAQEAIKKHGSLRKAAAALGVGATTLGRWKDGQCCGKKQGKKYTAKPEDVTSKKGKSLSEFRTAYDKDIIVPAKIKSAIKELGRNGWEYEVQFSRNAGVSLSDIATYREQFADYVVTIRRDSRRVWAGSIETAREMQRMVSK